MPEISGSLTADAIIRRTVEVTKTIDGLLMKRVFYDDFSRTVAQGLGGEWTWHPYDSWPASADYEANASVASGAAILISPNAGSAIYESYVGLPVPEQGELLFDFWTGTASQWALDRPTYGFTLAPWDYFGVYVSPRNQTLYPGGWYMATWATHDVEPIFTADQNSWYRVRHRWTSGGLFTRVWKVGTVEPTSWDNSNTLDTYNWAEERNKFPPFLDLYYSFDGPTEAMKVTNIEVWSLEPSWDKFGGLSATAELKQPWEQFAVSADAIVAKTIIKTGTPTNGRDVQFVGAEKNSSWSPVTSLSVAKPAEVQSGDQMVLSVITDDASNSRPASSGWSERFSAQEVDGSWMQIFTKTAGGSEPSSYAVLVSVATGINAVVTAWRGTATSNPTMLFASQYGSPYDQISSPVLANAAPGFLVEVFFSSSANPGSMTTPSGMTQAIQSTDYGIQQAVFYDVHAAGSAGGDSLTISNPDSGSPVRGSFLIFWTDGGTGLAAAAELTDRSVRVNFDAWILAKNSGLLFADIKRTQESYRTQIFKDGVTGYWKFDETAASASQPGKEIVRSEIGPDGLIVWPPYTSLDPAYPVYPGRGTIGAAGTKTGWIFPYSSGASYPIMFYGYGQGNVSKCSIECWVKTTASAKENWIWTSGDGLRLLFAGGKIILRSEKGHVYVQTTASFNDNILHHVVGVWDGTPGVRMLSSQLKIYVDGVSVAVTGYETPWWSDVWNAPYPGTTQAYVGSTQSSGSPAYQNGWDGFLDELAHYNGVALTPAQIAYHNWLGRQAATVPDLLPSAVIKRPQSSPFAKHDVPFDSFFVSPYRTTHPRDNTAHYDYDLDTVIAIATAIGVYAQGATVHEVLTGIYARLAAIEGIDNPYVPPTPVTYPQIGSLSAAAMLMRIAASSLPAASIVKRSSQVAVAIDSVVKRVSAGSLGTDAVKLSRRLSSINGDAVVRASMSSSATAGSIIRRVTTPQAAIDAIVHRVTATSVPADAVLTSVGVLVGGGELTADATINVLRSVSLAADAAILRLIDGQVSSDAVVRRAALASLGADAAVLRMATGQTNANSVFLRTSETSLGADAVMRTTAAGSVPVDAWFARGGLISINSIIRRNQPQSASADAVVRVLPNRLYQMPVEVVHNPTPKAQLYQLAAEVVHDPTPKARLSQLAVEVIVSNRYMLGSLTASAIVMASSGTKTLTLDAEIA